MTKFLITLTKRLTLRILIMFVGWTWSFEQKTGVDTFTFSVDIQNSRLYQWSINV